MMWDGNGHWGSGGDWVTLAVIVTIVFLVRYLSRTGGTSSMAAASPAWTGGSESPKDILKRCHTAGEIDRDEYLQRLGDLWRAAHTARTS